MRTKIAKEDWGLNRVAKINLVLLIAGLLAVFVGYGALQPDHAAATTAITTCGDCHLYPPVDNATQRDATSRTFQGSHNTHAGNVGSLPGYGMSCEVCHVSPNWTSFSHQNDNISINLRWISLSGGIMQSGSVSGWGSYSSGTTFPLSNSPAFGTCQNTYCHSNATGGTQNAGGDSRPINANTSPMWSTTIPAPGTVGSCVVCHGIDANNPGTGAPWYTSNPTSVTAGSKANDHQSHAWQTPGQGPICYKCHMSTTNTGNSITSVGNHIKGTYTVTPGPGQWYSYLWYSYTYTTNGGVCAANVCHGNTSPKWGTGTWDCITCHSKAFTKNLGTGTIRKVVGGGGDYNMSTVASAVGTRHLYGATTIVKWDCMVCHMAGNADTGRVDNNSHNVSGGKVYLRNVDSYQSGWAINNRTWTTTDYTNLDTFCLGCHDSDGASQIAVNATNNGLYVGTAAWNTTRSGWATWAGNGNNAALMPFNSTDYSAGYLKGSTSSPNAGSGRMRIVDIKTKFYAGSLVGASYNGNPSQHAVIGRRFSTVNANWAAAAWTGTILKKQGQAVNVTRETSLLSCADCHVLDAGRGAHGGANVYNLYGGGTTAAASNLSAVCWRCHANGVYPLSGTATAGSRINHDTSAQSIDGSGEITGSYSAYGMTSQPNCMLCHAGWNELTTVTRQASYGGIHGTGWQTSASWYTTPLGTRTAYRFFPGAYMRPTLASDTAWGSSVASPTCYFGTGDSTNTFANCTEHTTSGGKNPCSPMGTYNYGRPGKY